MCKVFFFISYYYFLLITSRNRKLTTLTGLGPWTTLYGLGAPPTLFLAETNSIVVSLGTY